MGIILLGLGAVIFIASFIAQRIQPQPTIWDKIAHVVGGLIGGVGGGFAVVGFQSLGLAIFGTAVGIPIIVVTGIVGGFLGPPLGRLFGDDTYGGDWQTAINVGYGLALGLAGTGVVFLVIGVLS